MTVSRFFLTIRFFALAFKRDYAALPAEHVTHWKLLRKMRFRTEYNYRIRSLERRDFLLGVGDLSASCT